MRRLVIVFLLIFSIESYGQTEPDQSFQFQIEKPIYDKGERPKVAIDAGHNNRHTKQTGLSHLSILLEQDGFVVFDIKEVFSRQLLDTVDILIVVNPLHKSNIRNWSLPCPSAFTDQEISVLQEWVSEGGKLFLSADHMPYGGAVQSLAKAFDVEWGNSFDNSKKQKWPPAVFQRKDQTLLSSPVTDSTGQFYQIDRIGTFTGSAFRSTSLTPFLVFSDHYTLRYPETAWKFTRDTKKENAQGWFQGAYGSYGKGKVVFMGESAMFTAQLRGKTQIGMNSRDAPQNKLLAINIFRYLSLD